jgi:aspartyl protease family protein
MRSVLTLAAIALAAAVQVPRYVMQTNGLHPKPVAMAAQHTAPVPQAAPTPVNSRSVTISRNAQGHFDVDARVDGRRLTFMVDTGASVIALTEDDAALLGYHPSQNAFNLLVSTANGIVRAAPIRLDRVEIEDLTVRDVAALVMPHGALRDNLLGMSFLSRLHRWEFANGKLVLEQ